MENLNEQANLIDKGVGKDALLPTSTYSSTPDISVSSAKSNTQKALDLIKGQGHQIQGEFQQFDPELDAGIMSGDNQNDVRAENQTGWQQTKAAAFNVVNELGLGTLEATALMADFDMHADAMMGKEVDFSNSISEILAQKKQELGDKYGKVYRNTQDQGKFDPTSGAFWAENAGSMASAVTLMIPSTGAVKLMGAAAKGSKVLRALRLGKTAKGAIKGMTSATLSRLGENAMEASEAVHSVKASLTGQVNPSTGLEYTDQEITEIAGEAGVNTWRMGWAMWAIDAFQYSKMFKGIDAARRTAKAVKPGVVKTVGNFVAKDMGSEGLEEGYQFIASQESQRLAKKTDDGTDFMERLGTYMEDDEFKTSVLMGMVGGGMFSGAGTYKQYRQKKQESKERLALKEAHSKNDALITGDSAKFEHSDDVSLITTAVQYSADGKLDMMEADLNDLYYEADDTLKENGVEDVEAYRKKVKRAKDLVKETGKVYNEIQNSDHIPANLKSVALATRMERRMLETRRTDIAEAYVVLDNEARKLYAAKELHTADQMVQLKTLMRNKNTKKANELAESISQSSNIYKDSADVMDNLKTSVDGSYDGIRKSEGALNKAIAERETTEEMLKTEKGQKELSAKVEKANKKRKKDAVDAISSKEKLKEDAAKLTPAEKVFQEERNEALKNFEEFETTEPDGINVFTTTHEQGSKTWVKGEVIKDKDGKLYRVEKPIRGSRGINAFALDKNEKNLKDSKGKLVPKQFYDLSELVPESKMPRASEWTVTKFKFENRKAIKARETLAINRNNDKVDGVVKTVNKEFSNFNPANNRGGNRTFDGDPTLEENLFGIDFELAAAPMTKGEAIEVELKLDSSKGFDAVLVMQDGKPISKLSKDGTEEQFDALKQHIAKEGGTIKAKVTGKRVTFSGNLGNRKDVKQSLRVLENSPFLPEGKIFLGSVKPGQSIMEFVAEDGSTKEVSWDADAKKSAWEQGKKTGEGNTYILLNNPEGDPVPIMLKESTLKEVVNSEGKSLVNEVMDRLDAAAVKTGAEIESVIQAYMDKGYTETLAIEAAMKDFQTDIAATEDTEFVPSPMRRAATAAFGPIVRLQGDEITRDADGKPINKNGKLVYSTGPNYLNVKMEYVPVQTEISGEKVLSRGRVVPMVTRSTPSEKVQDTYIKETVADRAIMEEVLGDRFTNLSLGDTEVDGSGTLAPDGGSYVKKAIDGGWVSTDLHAERPWVNPRMTIQLDKSATAATKGSAKKMTLPTEKKKSYSGAKAKTGKATAKVESDTSHVDEIVKSMGKDTNKVYELKADPTKRAKAEDKGNGMSMDEFVDTYLKGLIAPGKYMQQIYALANKNVDNGQSADARLRNAAKEIGATLVAESFESGANDTSDTDGETTVPEKTEVTKEPSSDFPFDIDDAKSKEFKLLADSLDIIFKNGYIGRSLLQKELRIGYNKAGRLVDKIESLGITKPLGKETRADILKSEEDAIRILAEYMATDLNLPFDSSDPFEDTSSKAKDNKESDSKPERKAKGSKKNVTFGRPKKATEIKAAEPSVETNKGENNDLHKVEEGSVIDGLLNDIQSAGETLSADAKAQIQKEAEVKCKK